MSAKPLPPVEHLNAILRYEPETGRLFWKERTAEMMRITGDRSQEWAANQWNSRHSGKEAFTFSDPSGYRHGKINGRLYQAHRVIWKILHGYDPDVIDHINGDTSDNRPENLRDCSVAENSRNYEKPKGSSKYRGVCWVERDRAWAARISDGKGGKLSLGNYKDEEAAAAAYDRAAKEVHGAFAVLNFGETQ